MYWQSNEFKAYQEINNDILEIIFEQLISQTIPFKIKYNVQCEKSSDLISKYLDNLILLCEKETTLYFKTKCDTFLLAFYNLIDLSIFTKNIDS